MNQSRSLDLLIELVRLLKKYGPDEFRSLAELLRNPVCAGELADTLRAVADNVNGAPQAKPAKSPPSERTGVMGRIHRLSETAPEKAAHLRAILESLSSTDGISTSAIREYAVRAGLPALPVGGRRKVVAGLIDTLFEMDLPALEAHARTLVTASTATRHLEGWSRIILDPTLRTRPGA